MADTLDIEGLKKRLRHPVRFGSETQEQAKNRHFMDRHEAADAIERLQAERDEAARALEISGKANRMVIEEAMSQAQRIKELERELEKMREVIARQAKAAKIGMDAAKSSAQATLTAAQKAQAESSPEALASERAANAALTEEVERLRAELEEAGKSVGAKQAEIDRLMLEYCPNEMTPEQKAEWAAHQRPAARQQKG